MRFTDPATHKTDLTADLGSTDATHGSPSLAVGMDKNSPPDIGYSSSIISIKQEDQEPTRISEVSCWDGPDVTRMHTTIYEPNPIHELESPSPLHKPNSVPNSTLRANIIWKMCIELHTRTHNEGTDGFGQSVSASCA